jgi:hypothetical protein
VLDISPALFINISSFPAGKGWKRERGEREKGDIRLKNLLTCLLMPELSLELLKRPSLGARCKVMYKGRYS